MRKANKRLLTSRYTWIYIVHVWRLANLYSDVFKSLARSRRLKAVLKAVTDSMEFNGVQRSSTEFQALWPCSVFRIQPGGRNCFQHPGEGLG